MNSRERYDDGGYPPGFWDWLAKNEHVFRAFVRLSMRTRRSGVQRWSADAACHVLRWQTAIRQRGAEGDFKIDNRMVAGLARLTMATQPKLQGFFELRVSAAQRSAAA